VIGHLGNRVSALLDGQLTARETEEAWAHVYHCHGCRDLVEREGWVKTRLAGLCSSGAADRGAPSDLKGSLLSMPPGDAFLADAAAAGSGAGAGAEAGAGRRPTGAVMLGGGAIGAAMLGVLALGFGVGSAPPADRRPPVTQINTSVPSAPATPAAPSAPATGSTPSGFPGNLPVPVRRMLP